MKHETYKRMVMSENNTVLRQMGQLKKTMLKKMYPSEVKGRRGTKRLNVKGQVRDYVFNNSVIMKCLMLSKEQKYVGDPD